MLLFVCTDEEEIIVVAQVKRWMRDEFAQQPIPEVEQSGKNPMTVKQQITVHYDIPCTNVTLDAVKRTEIILYQLQQVLCLSMKCCQV